MLEVLAGDLIVNSKQRPGKHKWFIALMIEAFVLFGKAKTRGTKVTAYENVILVRANSEKEAYRKAMNFGRKNIGSVCVDAKGRKGRWKFMGLADLLPMYERLSDGAELYWRKHVGKSIPMIKQMIRTRKEIEEGCGGSRNQ